MHSGHASLANVVSVLFLEISVAFLLWSFKLELRQRACFHLFVSACVCKRAYACIMCERDE